MEFTKSSQKMTVAISVKAASVVMKGSGDMIVIGGLIDDQRTTTSDRSGLVLSFRGTNTLQINGNPESFQYQTINEILFLNNRLSGGDGGSTEWRGGPQMQEPRAKFCAVSTESNRFAILGGETDEQAATAGKIG